MTSALPPGSTIAHLIETDGPGGAERVYAYLVGRFAEQGFHNLAIVPADGEGWLASQLPTRNVDVAHIPLRGVSLLSSLKAVVAVLRTARPAVMHCHEFTMTVLGAAAAWRLSVPLVVTMHGGRYYASGLHRLGATLVAARAASRIVAVSQSLADHLARDLWLPRSSLQVIPNGIPAMPFVEPTLRVELGLPPTAMLVVAVGNLYPVKGHAHLLEAVALLTADMGNPVHLAIAGRGSEEQALRRQATGLGLVDRVHLLGLRADIANILRSADVFVLPSLSEGLPLALLEAMRAGLPIVATDVGEVAAVLESGESGLVVEPGDPLALARALAQLLSDQGLAHRLGDRAARSSAERFSVEGMAEAYLRLYGTAVSSG